MATISGSNGGHAKAPFDPIAWLRREWATALGFVLGLAISAHYVYFVVTAEQQKQREAAFTTCQAGYNQAFAGQLLARAAAADAATAADQAEAAATRSLLSGFAQLAAAPPDSRAQKISANRSRELFTEYALASVKVAQARAAVAAARAAHPLPQIPDC